MHNKQRQSQTSRNKKPPVTLQELGIEVRGGYIGEHVAVSRAFGNVHLLTGQKVQGFSASPKCTKLTLTRTLTS